MYIYNMLKRLKKIYDGPTVVLFIYFVPYYCFNDNLTVVSACSS